MEEAALSPGDEFKLGDVILWLESMPEIRNRANGSTISLAPLPFVAKATCANSGNVQVIPNLIEEVIRLETEAGDLDQRIAGALRREFRAEGAFSSPSDCGLVAYSQKESLAK